MRQEDTVKAIRLCPSARPEMVGSVVFGIGGGTTDAPQVGYLREPIPVTPELLALSRPVEPTEVFRFAAPCAGRACRHYTGSCCSLVKRMVRLVPIAVRGLPVCSLRPRCRWWQEEGRPACLRCPQIVTDSYAAGDAVRRAAGTAAVP